MDHIPYGLICLQFSSADCCKATTTLFVSAEILGQKESGALPSRMINTHCANVSSIRVSCGRSRSTCSKRTAGNLAVDVLRRWCRCSRWVNMWWHTALHLMTLRPYMQAGSINLTAYARCGHQGAGMLAHETYAAQNSYRLPGR